jgi:hypothetical protein
LPNIPSSTKTAPVSPPKEVVLPIHEAREQEPTIQPIKQTMTPPSVKTTVMVGCATGKSTIILTPPPFLQKPTKTGSPKPKKQKVTTKKGTGKNGRKKTATAVPTATSQDPTNERDKSGEPTKNIRDHIQNDEGNVAIACKVHKTKIVNLTSEADFVSYHFREGKFLSGTSCCGDNCVWPPKDDLTVEKKTNKRVVHFCAKCQEASNEEEQLEIVYYLCGTCYQRLVAKIPRQRKRTLKAAEEDKATEEEESQ